MKAFFRIFLFLLTFFQCLFASSGEQLLITAVETGDFGSCKQLIQSGVNYNYHNIYNSSDFSSSDWSILMKALARFGSLVIEAQSFINTVDSVVSDIALPLNIVGGATSLYKWNILPIGVTAATSFFSQKTASYLIRRHFDKNIKAQFNIVLLLLDQADIEKEYVTHRDECAESLFFSIERLFYSPHLLPPFGVGKVNGEKDYACMLDEIGYHINGSEKKSIFVRPDLDFGVVENHFIKSNANFKKITETLPIVFDQDYDITFFGLENLHPFDTKKYGKIAKYLQKQFPYYRSFQPQTVSEENMLTVHTKEYLELVKKPYMLGFIADMPILCLLPYCLVKKLLMKPVIKAVGGTLKAVEVAKEYGLAFNLSGGYHHAKTNDPVYGGFCIINDACIAAKKLLQENPNYKILIIDLDAHQGNGNAEAVRYEKNVAIFDMYNADTWPGDFQTQERINFPILLKAKSDDIEYLQLLETYLPRVIDSVKPDFIIYNAGTDIYEKDPLGCLSVSAAGIITRDEIVFHQATSRHIPIMMLLSGGYHKDLENQL